MRPSFPCPQCCWPSSRNRWPCAAVSLCRGSPRAPLRRQPVAMCKGVASPSPPCPCACSSAIQQRRCLRRRSHCRRQRWGRPRSGWAQELRRRLPLAHHRHPSRARRPEQHPSASWDCFLLASLLAFGWFCSSGRSGGRCSLRRGGTAAASGATALSVIGGGDWFTPTTSISSFCKSASMSRAPTSGMLRGARDLTN